MLTIADRLTRTAHALTLIESAAAVTNRTHGERDAVLAAIAHLAGAARTDMHWLTSLPPFIQAVPAPTDDDLTGDWQSERERLARCVLHPTATNPDVK